MEAYQQRVVDEKSALDEKTIKLNEFLAGEKSATLLPDERERMHRQAGYMNLYSEVLRERIEAFPV